MECVWALVALGHAWLCHLFSSMVKIIEGGKDIVSDGLSGVGTEFLVCGRVG